MVFIVTFNKSVKILYAVQKILIRNIVLQSVILLYIFATK